MLPTINDAYENEAQLIKMFEQKRALAEEYDESDAVVRNDLLDRVAAGAAAVQAAKFVLEEAVVAKTMADWRRMAADYLVDVLPMSSVEASEELRLAEVSATEAVEAVIMVETEMSTVMSDAESLTPSALFSSNRRPWTTGTEATDTHAHQSRSLERVGEGAVAMSTWGSPPYVASGAVGGAAGGASLESLRQEAMRKLHVKAQKQLELERIKKLEAAELAESLVILSAKREAQMAEATVKEADAQMDAAKLAVEHAGMESEIARSAARARVREMQDVLDRSRSVKAALGEASALASSTVEARAAAVETEATRVLEQRCEAVLTDFQLEGESEQRAARATLELAKFILEDAREAFEAAQAEAQEADATFLEAGKAAAHGLRGPPTYLRTLKLRKHAAEVGMVEAWSSLAAGHASVALASRQVGGNV